MKCVFFPVNEDMMEGMSSDSFRSNLNKEIFLVFLVLFSSLAYQEVSISEEMKSFFYMLSSWCYYIFLLTSLFQIKLEYRISNYVLSVEKLFLLFLLKNQFSLHTWYSGNLFCIPESKSTESFFFGRQQKLFKVIFFFIVSLLGIVVVLRKVIVTRNYNFTI